MVASPQHEDVVVLVGEGRVTQPAEKLGPRQKLFAVRRRHGEALLDVRPGIHPLRSGSIQPPAERHHDRRVVPPAKLRGRREELREPRRRLDAYSNRTSSTTFLIPSTTW